MLNKKEIIKKKHYFIKKLLMGNNTPEEDQMLRESLIAMISLIRGNEQLCNVKLYNRIDLYTFGSLSLNKLLKKKVISHKIINKFNLEIDDDYLMYLIQLVVNAKRMEHTYFDYEFPKMDLTDDKVVELSKEFYNSLGNEELTTLANKIIDDDSHYGFSDEFGSFVDTTKGFTVSDEIFDKSYISILRTNDLIECQAFCHEVMHAISYSSKKFLLSDKFNLFEEIAPFAITYLYLDFLEEKDFDLRQVNLLRKYLVLQICYNAEAIFEDICLKLLLTEGYDASSFIENNPSDSIEKIRSVLDYRIIKRLLLVESLIIAYGLYKQMLDDKEMGLENLNKLIKEKIPNDQLPDFSFIGLDRKTILDLSRELGDIKYGEISNKRRR